MNNLFISSSIPRCEPSVYTRQSGRSPSSWSFVQSSKPQKRQLLQTPRSKCPRPQYSSQPPQVWRQSKMRHIQNAPPNPHVKVQILLLNHNTSRSHRNYNVHVSSWNQNSYSLAWRRYWILSTGWWEELSHRHRYRCMLPVGCVFVVSVSLLVHFVCMVLVMVAGILSLLVACRGVVVQHLCCREGAGVC